MNHYLTLYLVVSPVYYQHGQSIKGVRVESVTRRRPRKKVSPNSIVLHARLRLEDALFRPTEFFLEHAVKPPTQDTVAPGFHVSVESLEPAEVVEGDS